MKSEKKPQIVSVNTVFDGNGNVRAEMTHDDGSILHLTTHRDGSFTVSSPNRALIREGNQLRMVMQ